MRTRSLVVLLAALGAAACTHAKAAACPTASQQAPTPQAKPATQLVATTTPATAPESDAEADARRELEQAIAQLQGTSVFFDTDDAALTVPGQQALARIGEVLAKHSALAIRVEGNCDERGTADYNIVLGQRRADAARRYILYFGAKANQVGTVSYGAEKPRETGHDEKAWSQNRRDDIQVTKSTN